MPFLAGRPLQGITQFRGLYAVPELAGLVPLSFAPASALGCSAWTGAAAVTAGLLLRRQCFR